ncbi:MAG: YkgJ family cysteine cluster protein [Eggerthellaceae bacterium]|nr:YkgJ family cysteine cluster protein [Eggerthellaceae bacterium]
MPVQSDISNLSRLELIELHRAIGQLNQPRDIFSGRGTHVGCGECCSRILPMTEQEANVLRKAVADRSIQLRPEMAEIDFTCPLLSDDKTCMVYDVRPFICRTYSCTVHAAGGMPVKHPFHHKVEFVDMREVLA